MKFQLITNGYEQHAALLRTRALERACVEFGDTGAVIELAVDGMLGAKESYGVYAVEGGWRIVGSDELGLYYGIGKALHSANWAADGMRFLPTNGVITPACDFRAIYYAVHFYNWYHMAPADELERYLEDLLLWGYNTIICITPAVNLDSFEDQLFHDSISNMHRIFSTAKRFGMRVGAILHPNQGLRTAPHELDAAPLPFPEKRGDLGRNLCPSKPGTRPYMENIWRNFITPFKDVGLDYILTWPYDEGGCGCDKCRPWGANMYGTAAKWIRDLAKEIFPDVKMILATWAFDATVDEGEYAGLYKRLAGDMDWVDYVMVDSHGAFPQYALDHAPVKPIVNFPEISMWGLAPWGGFGANPLPERFHRLWNSAKHVLKGGLPYSEGLYEDISKVQCVSYYWDPDRDWRDIYAEYINYEYDAAVTDDAIELCRCIEQNHTCIGDKVEPTLPPAHRALELAKAIDARLSERVKKSWRWRILYIRAVLDAKRYEKFPYGSDDPKKFRRFRLFSGDLLLEDAEAQALFLELWGYYHCIPHNGENHHTLPPYGGTKLQVVV